MQTRRSFSALLLAGPLSAATAPIDPADLTITDALGLLRSRRLTPLELTQSCLKRLEQRNGKLNAMVTPLAERALAEARSLIPSQLASQPLGGIPIALKDLYDTAGIRTTAASAHWKDRVPGKDATAVRRLHDAGTVLLGKANMDEFAYNFTAETSVFGVARNPWNTECTPGGSSGGSAVAVGSGMCLAALGSDTGGSIRLPAALCGVTGFKPTFGTIPTDGVAPLAWSLDHVGSLTKTARDAALLHGVLSGKLPALSGTKSLRVGVARTPYWQGIDDEVGRALETSLEVLKRLTSEVRDTELPPLPTAPQSPLPRTYSTVLFAEAWTFHRPMLERNPDRYHPGTKTTIEFGKPISASDYILARREMDRLRAAAADQLLANVDVLITPTAPAPAFRFGTPPDLIFLRNVSPWNLYGLPSISVPCGLSKGGLPIGLQITGRPHRDDVVLSLAAAFQNETDFHTQRPPV